ncbi:hypothetical protein GCM10023173_10670 [Sphingobacterium thermophilum]|uniref:Uncharacterized protein n=1 Tax=Sphingobacterium thermophilum TaxID=768534 RepID=A0ABP8QZP8_9SPHI
MINSLSNKTPFILNIFTALYLIYIMPQNIFFEENYSLLKATCVIIVDICSISILVYSLKMMLFPHKK